MSKKHHYNDIEQYLSGKRLCVLNFLSLTEIKLSYYNCFEQKLTHTICTYDTMAYHRQRYDVT